MNLDLLSCFSEQDGVNVKEEKVEEDTKEDTADTQTDDDEEVKVTSSTEIRELYTITPSASFADSSDDDDNGCTEKCPLVTNELTSFESTTSTDLPEPSSLKRTSWENRPLLSRQLEIDQGSQSSKDTIVNCIDQEESKQKSAEEFPRPKVPTTLAVSQNHDELESQRVTPILFTLSPTKKGAHQVVSVVATRDLPTAFSRPQSMPSSPCTRKSKSARSPRSPTSFRSFFGCHSSSEKDIDQCVSGVSPKTSNGSISAPNTAIGGCENNTVSERTFNEHGSKDIIPNGDMLINCKEISKEHQAESDGMFNGHSKDVFSYTEHQNEMGSTSKPVQNAISSDETKSPLAEDALIMFHSEPLPARVPILSHRTLQQDSLSEKGSNTNDSFDESTNNSDKGYESVDNSPCVESEDSICRSLNTNGSGPLRRISKLAYKGISETQPENRFDDFNVIINEPPKPKGSVWVPLMDSEPPARRKKVTEISTSQQDCNLFSQTAV